MRERDRLVAEGHDARDAAGAVGRVGGQAALHAGVTRGDFVLNVNGRPVKTVKEFREAVSKAGKAVALLVQRGGSQIFIPIRGE